jgi:putative transcriptional regulator
MSNTASPHPRREPEEGTFLTTAPAMSKCLPLAAIVATILHLTSVLTPLCVDASSPADPSYLQSRLPTSLEATSTPAVQPSTGTFLIATAEIRDPRFMETVIILIKYDREGAVGLIINRPTEMKLSDVLSDKEELGKISGHLYIGGPVGINQVFMLVRSKTQPDDALKVFGDVYVSGSSALLENLSAREDKETFRVYAGYAGWAPGQLEMEIARGGWHVAQADEFTIFEKPSAEIWKDLSQRNEIIEVHHLDGSVSPMICGLPAFSLP